MVVNAIEKSASYKRSDLHQWDVVGLLEHRYSVIGFPVQNCIARIKASPEGGCDPAFTTQWCDDILCFTLTRSILMAAFV